MIEEEDLSFTFSDEDFERRYSSEKTAPCSRPAAREPRPPAGQPTRSRNRFMRTLLRRRLAAAQSRS